MTAGIYDLPIETNADFYHQFAWAEDDNSDGTPGDPISLDGFTAKLEMASDYIDAKCRVVYYSISTTLTSDDAGLTINGSAGTIDLFIPVGDCKQMSFDAVYDLMLYDEDGSPWRFLKGAVLLDQGVTL